MVAAMMPGSESGRVTFLGCGTYCLSLDLPMLHALGLPWPSVVFYSLALIGLSLTVLATFSGP